MVVTGELAANRINLHTVVVVEGSGGSTSHESCYSNMSIEKSMIPADIRFQIVTERIIETSSALTGCESLWSNGLSWREKQAVCQDPSILRENNSELNILSTLNAACFSS